MTAIQNTTVTYNGERFTFNTATTLSEEMARLRRQGGNVVGALKGFKVAYIKDGELGVDDCDHRTIGTLDVDSDGDLDYTTALGDGQRGNIDSSGRVRRRNSHYITYPTDSDFYVEASYFAAKPHLGKVQKITVEQAIANGESLSEIAEKYYVGVARPGSLEPLKLSNRGNSNDCEAPVEGHFYTARHSGPNLRIGDWYIADHDGHTASSIDTSGGSSSTSWNVVLLPKGGEAGYTTHLPLSEMTLEDVRKFLNAVGVGTEIQFYLGTKPGNLVARPLSYDPDAPGNRFKSANDWRGYTGATKAIASVLNDEFTLKTFGTCIWIDADTVKRYAPDYYSVPGGDFAEGALIATPDARILRVVEVTDKFIIAQHPAGHGETIALPITEGVEYKRVDEEVASAIL